MVYTIEKTESTTIVLEQEVREQEFVARRPLELSTSLPLSVEALPTHSSNNQKQGRWGIQTLLSRFFSQQLQQRIKKMAPWLISGSILGLNLVLHAPTFVIGALMASLTIRTLKAIIHSSPVCQKAWQWLLKKANLSDKQIPWLTAGFAGGAWFTAAMPSSALFFDSAEQYVTRIFTGAAGAGGGTAVTTLIPLLFGTLRVIFVLYIGIALVRVINAFRNDEDWGTAARIPLITVLCVVIGDALSSLIVSGGTGGGI